MLFGRKDATNRPPPKCKYALVSQSVDRVKWVENTEDPELSAFTEQKNIDSDRRIKNAFCFNREPTALGPSELSCSVLRLPLALKFKSGEFLKVQSKGNFGLPRGHPGKTKHKKHF